MRKLTTALFILLSSISCLGQSRFQEITPGASTRNDVTRVLGQSVQSISPTLIEYTPPAGIAKVEVEYHADIVERIEIYFVRPISAQALIQKFGLSHADARRTSAEEKLVEYFGGSSLIAFTYAGADATSGVSRIGYYSSELFAKAVRGSPGARPNPVTRQGSSDSSAAGLGEMNLPDYMRPPAGSTSTTVDRAGRPSTSRDNAEASVSGETNSRKATARSSTSSGGRSSAGVSRRPEDGHTYPSRPAAIGDNDDGSPVTELVLSSAELKRFVGTYEFIQPTGLKPAEVTLIGGKLRLTVGTATHTLSPIFGDDFVVGDQGESDLFSFRAADAPGVKVYFTTAVDKLKTLYIVENQRQPKRFYIAVPKH